jgi:hypothetical protein
LRFRNRDVPQAHDIWVAVTIKTIARMCNSS